MAAAMMQEAVESDLSDVVKNVSDSIERLEKAMLAQPQVACDVVHSFAPGLYIRQVNFKAGTLAIGHHQKTIHLNVMLTGRATMVETDGSIVERSAPLVYVAGPGRKCGYIHEDVIWLNIYSTIETDVEKLEAALLDKSETWKSSQPLLAYDRLEDVADFAAMLDELGISADIVRTQSENESDQIAFQVGSYRAKVAKSRIEGLGLFATGEIKAGEVIAPARVGGMRTPAGRYTNHAKHPNAVMRALSNGDIELVALRDIGGCRGGFDGEEITIDYRQALKVNRTAKRIPA